MLAASCLPNLLIENAPATLSFEPKWSTSTLTRLYFNPQHQPQGVSCRGSDMHFGSAGDEIHILHIIACVATRTMFDSRGVRFQRWE